MSFGWVLHLANGQEHAVPYIVTCRLVVSWSNDNETFPLVLD